MNYWLKALRIDGNRVLFHGHGGDSLTGRYFSDTPFHTGLTPSFEDLIKEWAKANNIAWTYIRVNHVVFDKPDEAFMVYLAFA